jgi:hypothetical protein
MITYLGMTMPMSVCALVSWLRHPYEGKKAEVEVNRIGKKDILSEGNAKLRKARLARSADETGDVITIYYVKPEGGKYFECFGFSRTHSTA